MEESIVINSDLICVRLLLELRARISNLPAGIVTHLTATDPAALVDLPAWCHLTGHAYPGTIPALTPTYALRTFSAPVTIDPASRPCRERETARPGQPGRARDNLALQR